MSFRTKLFLIFLITVLASVSLVAYGVTHYTQAALEEMDAQRTDALVAQFQKEFAQRGEEVVHQVEISLTRKSPCAWRSIWRASTPTPHSTCTTPPARRRITAWISWNS